MIPSEVLAVTQNVGDNEGAERRSKPSAFHRPDGRCGRLRSASTTTYSLERALRSSLTPCENCLGEFARTIYQWECPECGQKKFSESMETPICPNIDCMLDDVEMEFDKERKPWE